MPLTLEWLLTAPEAFDLGQGHPEKATPVQRAICRAGDGLPLGDLAEHPRVIDDFGGREAVANLHVGSPPDEVVLCSAIRGAKSILCGCAAVRCAMTVDLSPTQEGETVQVPILSLNKEKAHAVHRHLVNAFTRPPTPRRPNALRSILASKPTGDTIRIRRPAGTPGEGRIIEIVVVAGARAGGAVVANWLAALIFDEAPRMLGEDEGVINLDETRTAALGRILPGGQIWEVGSPWAPRGPIYTAVRRHFGKPSKAIVVIRAPGPDLNPDWWNPKRVEEMRNKPDRRRRSSPPAAP